MTVDWWSLGLQALNAGILVWLLGRVFWRPVAGAIAARTDAARAMLEDAATHQRAADALEQDLLRARQNIAQERAALLASAAAEADVATKTTLDAARVQADDMLAAAQDGIARTTATARKRALAEASDLSVDIAARLLARLGAHAAQTAFLEALITALSALPDTDRAALADAKPLRVISAAPLDGAAQSSVHDALTPVLGNGIALEFSDDPALIAGLELHSPHFVIHNSFQSDLATIRKDLPHEL